MYIILIQADRQLEEQDVQQHPIIGVESEQYQLWVQVKLGK